MKDSWQSFLTSGAKMSLFNYDASKSSAGELSVFDLGKMVDTISGGVKSNQVIFIDTAVQDYMNLISNINSDARIVLLDSSRDGIDQISDYLTDKSNLDAIHIISHGIGGSLILTGQTYSADRLADYQVDLARIGSSLKAGGDILLYGCDIGNGSAGEHFINEVARMTGMDVAASVDKTGAVDLGGNWVLEVKTAR